MSQQIMQSSAGVQYPTLMRTSYGSQNVNEVGGDNSAGKGTSVTNFGAGDGMCNKMCGLVEVDASNLNTVNTTISSIDSKIARNFK